MGAVDPIISDPDPHHLPQQLRWTLPPLKSQPQSCFLVAMQQSRWGFEWSCSSIHRNWLAWWTWMEFTERRSCSSQHWLEDTEERHQVHIARRAYSGPSKATSTVSVIATPLPLPEWFSAVPQSSHYSQGTNTWSGASLSLAAEGRSQSMAFSVSQWGVYLPSHKGSHSRGFPKTRRYFVYCTPKEKRHLHSRTAVIPIS